MIYKAILTDVDRTLVRSKDAMPSDEVRDAIQSLEGVAHVGLATSRPYEKIRHLVEYLHLYGPSIISNGAQIVNVTDGKMYHEYLINAAALHF